MWLVTAPIKFENAQKGLLELVVGQSIAERIEWTVEVAQPVGDVIQQVGHARLSTEPDDQRENVPRCPADYECTKNYADGAKCQN